MSDVTAKIVTPPPPPQPDARRVVLEMPYDVAVTLMRLTEFVGGDPGTTYRKHTDRIREALYAQDVECDPDEHGERFAESGDLGLQCEPLPTTSTE